MKVSLEAPQLLQNHDAHLPFSRVVGTISDAWHHWAGPDPDDDALRPYVATRPVEHALLTKSYVETHAYGRRGRTVRIVDRLAEPGRLECALDDAVTYLNEPVSVLVENKRNDGRFLHMFLRPVAPDLVQVMRHPRPPLIFDNGGGKGEMTRRAAHEVTERTHPLPPRFVVIADSDSARPGDLGDGTTALRTQCERHGVRVHVLEKRAIENYVSDRLLDAYAASELGRDKVDDVAAICVMTAERRDHYPMKNGKVKVGAEQAFFEPEPWIHADGTRRRPEVPRIMEFVLGLRGDAITIADLDDRSARGEMAVIAAMLEEMI